MIFSLLLSIALAGNNFHHFDLNTAWKKWSNEFGHTETVMMHGLSDERKQAFAYNYALVRQHNSMNTSWTLELNEFAAMPFDEFRQRNGYKRYMRENAPKATSVHKMSGIEDQSSSTPSRTKDNAEVAGLSPPSHPSKVRMLSSLAPLKNSPSRTSSTASRTTKDAATDAEADSWITLLDT